MPNRVIKESIKRSPQIDSLTWFEEVVFYRLLVTADDYGCLDGRTVLLRNELFPTKENITRKSIDDAIRKLVSAGLLCKYKVNGMPYLFFPTWEKHQRIRNKHRKYPNPPDDFYLTANCCQMTADCQSESESESESESNPKEDSAEQFSAPPVISLPLNDGTDFTVSAEQCQEWAGLYPAVDVIQQLREMRGWLDANPTRRKTRRGIKAFVVRWLSKEQDQSRTRSNSSGNVFLEIAREEGIF